MIDIVMVAPYEGSRAFIQGIVDRYESKQPVNIAVRVFENSDIPQMVISGDVIIARGYNMQLIGERCNGIPILPMDVSGYDIIKAITTAQKSFNSQKVAIIGPSEMIDSVENIRDILNIGIKCYSADIDMLDETIEKARKDGCDCFVGGYSVIEHCRPDDNKVLVKVGQSTIVNSLNEAIRTVNYLREQQRLSARYKTLVDNSKDGIISVGEKGEMTSFNRTAQAYLHLGVGAVGKQVKDYLPFFTREVIDLLRSGKRIENEICCVNGRMLTADCMPLNSGSKVEGAIIFIRSIDVIQRDESQIRKKMTIKGQRAKYSFDDIIYSSKQMKEVIEVAKMYAKTSSPVLIIGESGTGKELMAQSIHNYSNRSDGPFIGINCAAHTESLLESELFGYIEGAFTGAVKGGREGLFEAAHGGTIFLDEISEIPISFQSKLLRVIQENEVRRVGSQKVTAVDVRVLAASNKDLEEQVRKGLFRQDLLFRLNVLPLDIPPLRRRVEDVLVLFRAYLSEFEKQYYKHLLVITGEAKKMLQEYPWYGNARELKNIAERIYILTPAGKDIDEYIVRKALYWNESIKADSPASNAEPGDDYAMDNPSKEDELNLIRELLDRYGGNKSKVAQYLGIDRTTLWRRMQRLEKNDATK